MSENERIDKPKVGILTTKPILVQSYTDYEQFIIQYSKEVLNDMIQSNKCNLWLILPPGFDFIDNTTLTHLVDKLIKYQCHALYSDYLLYYKNNPIQQYLPTINDEIIINNLPLECPLLITNTNGECFIEEKNIIWSGLKTLYSVCNITHIPEFCFTLGK